MLRRPIRKAIARLQGRASELDPQDAADVGALVEELQAQAARRGRLRPHRRATRRGTATR